MKCLPCRIARRKEWQGRLMLEREQHRSACFPTLTYRDADLALDVEEAKRDHTLLLKKLRERVGKVRYYSVLHAGETTKRLHWHMALFGYRPGNHVNPTKRKPDCGCSLCLSWGLGGVYVGELTVESAGYIVGYLTEKEKAIYATMSRKPGIGALSADELGSFYTQKTGARVLGERGDVVGAVRRGGRLWPLGRYLRGRLRQAAGMEVAEPQRAHDARVRVRQDALRAPGGVAELDLQRVNDQAKAARSVQISRSKKGIGL